MHPLAKYPGPSLAAISYIWYAKKWLEGRYPWAVEELFDKYDSEIVRVGPNEIALRSPQAQHDIYTAAVRNRETFVKTEFQDLGGDEPGITAERDPEKHRSLAKLLTPAFSPRAMHAQEIHVHRYVDLLVEQLSRHGGTCPTGVDMREWFDWLVCDIAGYMAWSHEFDNLKNAQTCVYLRESIKIGRFGTIRQVLKKFPLLFPLTPLFVPKSLAQTIPTWFRFNREIVAERLSKRERLEGADYFSSLLREDSSVDSEEWLVAQSNVLLAAGFDPLTNILTSALYYLCKTPRARDRLQDEIRGEFDSYADIKAEKLQSTKYIQAVIDEAMRLHTNAAFGLPRYSPGAVVDGEYIPKGTIVQNASFAATHSSKYFLRPREFWPERFLGQDHKWYDESFGRYDNMKVFKPFSQGPRACPGREIGMMQARITLAKLIWTYDMELLNHGTDWERESKLFLIWDRPEVRVRFHKRM
ncbi:cytochrome P450 [Colletotrichum graminicola M1.001]|uniref:Cytochrome P450 n=1 Tax=Colletotrichum graminicola (strain M1.001 / M2 / FGSC 10212) TaxID=645133 RepID=E3QV07_COLGM|nr:cytochrome P450 [Colletotrichum graminicola M1.001]EFQ34697.1 cytochrome P450 [Colletotrichum graminicola M1.001]